MKRKIIAILLTMMMLFSSVSTGMIMVSAADAITPANAAAVAAPSEDLQLHFWLDESGVPYYNIIFRGNPLIENSKLGLKLSTGDLAGGFTLSETVRSSGDQTWSPIAGEKETILDRYHAAAFVLTSAGGKSVIIEARVYDTGAAFRYLLPEGNYVVSGEYTQYKLPAGTVADVHSGGNQTIPRRYQSGQLTGTYRSPMTLTYPNGSAMTICEANIDNFPPLRLRVESTGTLNAVYGTGSSTAVVKESDPSATPWRTFVVGDSLIKLPENADIILNLNEAPEGDFSWVQSGKNIMTTGNNNLASMKKWIDCAKEQNYQYVLIDTGWYGPEWDDRCDPRLDPSALEDGSELSALLKQYVVGDGHFRHPGFPMYGKLEESGSMVVDLNIPEVCAYAQEQGVGIILYVEDRALFDTRGRFSVEELFTRFESWGVAGVKPGFVQYQTQEHQRRLEEMIASAAKHRLVMTIHDEYVPTGIERTYPNCLTTEGILGDEGINGDQIAEDISVLFTRLIQGPSDHTFCYPGKGTKGYALASPILFKSGMQSVFWYGAPSGVAACNQNEIKLWRDMPAEWDELKVLEGEMYEYATYARRSGTDWFVGSLSAVDRNLRIPLTFLENDTPYVAEIYADPLGVDGTLSGGIASVTGTEKATMVMRLNSFLVDNETALKWVMAYGTGYAARLRPATEQDIATLERYDTFPLRTKIEQANLFEEELYTIPTWQTLTEAVAAGQALLEAGANPTPAQLEDAEQAIDSAIKGLRSVAGLVRAIQKTETLPANHYTSETWDVLQQAVQEAKALLTAADVTQEQIDTAQAAVTNAYANLKKKNMETDTVTYLSDLPYEPNSTSAWGPIRLDRSHENPQLQLMVNGTLTTFAKGLGVHATSNIYYNIEGKGYEIFEAVVGVDAIKPVQGNIVFRVYGDEKLLYESRPSGTGSNNAQFISVPVANVGILRLEANMYDSDNGDHGDWADAKLLTMKELDPASTLSGIQIDGTPLPEFAPAQTHYTLPCPPNGVVPQVTVTVPNQSVTYTVEHPNKTPGTVTITVTRPDGSTMVYTLDFLPFATSYVSDSQPSSTSKLGTDYGGWYKDISFEGNPMSVTAADGSEMNFPKGVGMHASFSATYDITGKGYNRFRSWVGASHWKTYNNNMIFRVYLNGSDQPAFDSGVMTHLLPAKLVDIDLTGVDTITLVLDKNGSDSGDHGNWADAKFLTYLDMPAKEIVSVANPEARTVTYGTPFSSLRLPTKLLVTLDDSSVEEYDVAWKTSDYDGNTAGLHRISGTLTLPSGVSNSQNIEVVAVVTVREPSLPGITSITIDGNKLLDFDVDRQDYTYPVLFGSDIPVVGATEAGEGIQVEVLQAPTANGTARINVTRTDASVVTYTIRFLYGEITYLSDLNWVSLDKMGTTYGSAVKDNGVEGHPMVVTAADGSEMRFAKGIGMQASCAITYDIEGAGYDRLEGWLGASHSKEYNNSMIFEIYADDEAQPRYRSTEMKYRRAAAYVNLDVSGVKTLKLVLDKNGVDSGDHGNWADIKFLRYRDLTQFSASPEEPVYKNTPFHTIITTSSDIQSLSFKNENDRPIGIVSIEREINQHGGYTWDVVLSAGTVGDNRTLQVYGDGGLLGSFSFDVLPIPSGIYHIASPNSTKVNESFEVTVRTTKDLIKGKFVNEHGNTIGSTRISRIVEGDYITTVYHLAVGTAGARTLTFLADVDRSSVFPYAQSFDITVAPLDAAEILSVTAPESTGVGEAFDVALVCSATTKEITFWNESGRGIGKTLKSLTQNTDGTVTFVYTISIGTKGERSISLLPSGESTADPIGTSFAISIV